MRVGSLWLVAVLLLVGSATITEAQTGNGSLKVTSYPSGAEVSIDGRNTGKTTPMSESLSVGVAHGVGGGRQLVVQRAHFVPDR